MWGAHRQCRQHRLPTGERVGSGYLCSLACCSLTALKHRGLNEIHIIYNQQNTYPFNRQLCRPLAPHIPIIYTHILQHLCFNKLHARTERIFDEALLYLFLWQWEVSPNWTWEKESTDRCWEQMIDVMKESHGEKQKASGHHSTPNQKGSQWSSDNRCVTWSVSDFLKTNLATFEWNFWR